ncbi:alpha/beta hydrolase [Massilia forsythiae]|uniref:Alpha/beta hydrolase n=2 Tax=Massilia forsythiae TaxID=2728020 RepID=A0A7Z2W2E7_9BURK|nr:alpha/beta hydrolase [Massilia forsythiae]
MGAALLAVLAPLAQSAAQTAAASVAAPAPAPAPAPESYTAETTWAKLAKTYPFIRIASRAVPATVRAVEDITYVQRGTHALQLDLYLPAAKAGERPPAPAIVLVHGGGWRAGLRSNLAPLAIRLAERGYAAATIGYRLSPEAGYPAAVLDAKAAVRWLRAHGQSYGIDGARIAIGGASAGGQVASLAGVTADREIVEPAAAVDAADAATAPGKVSSAVQAIVNIDGLSDFTAPEALRYEDDPAKQPSSAGAWFGGRYAQKEALWREASPTFHVTRETPPILFIGSAQPRFSMGREAMIGKMTALGIPSRVVMVPDTPHSFWLFDPWLAPTVEATAAFLDKYLRGAGS